MKGKIKILILGILIGVICTTAVFLVYNKLISKKIPDNIPSDFDEKFKKSLSEDMKNRPEKFEGLNEQELLAKPNESNFNENT